MTRRILVLSALALMGMFALTACGGAGAYGGSSSSGGGGTTDIITSIQISPASSSVASGGMQQYTVNAKDINGKVVTTPPTFNWTSSNNSVATVNSSGLAMAVGAGSATISASISYTSSGGIYAGMGTANTYTSNKATLTVTSSGMTMGTVAMGAPMPGAVVTISDSRGQTETGMSDANGHFLLSTAGLHAPFILKAEDNQGHVLYGFGGGEGVANVTSVTDLMARSWFAAQGSSVEAAFADPAAHAAPGAADLARLDGSFTQAMSGSLAAQGLDVDTFSFSSTGFVADGTGADRVLDGISVDTSAGHLGLDDRLGGQHIDVTIAGHMPALKLSPFTHAGQGT